MKTRAKPSRLSLVAALLLSSACGQILSIEDAHVDPTLSAGTGGTGGATSGISGALSESLPAAGMGGESGAEGDSGPVTHGGSESGGKPSSGGSTTTSTPSEGGAAGGAPPQTDDLCERYCDQVTRVCKGKYEQYRTFEQCIAVCKHLPPGASGDQDVNTVSCRLRQAELADAEPFLYCKSAGPLGANKCGSNCISYCSLMQEACTKQNTAVNLEPSYYGSSQECLAACGALPPDDMGPTAYSSSMTADPPSFVGNNVFCRTYHVASSLEEDTPTEHCPHAMGGDPCNQQ